ncbi:MAG TPA: L-histidine N(alpha)-methyltransferase [Candidatus Obscuribacterales bacterium]
MNEEILNSNETAPDMVPDIAYGATFHLVPGSRPTPSQFGKDIVKGLSFYPKAIPSRYLYDNVGSVLFDAISQLQEYPCTRGEKRLLNKHKREIIAALPAHTVVAELGAGNGSKAAILLAELSVKQIPTIFHDIDISAAAISQCRMTISTLPAVNFNGYAADYLQGLQRISSMRHHDQALLLLFLGSSIGNYEQAEAVDLMKGVREQLRAGDFLLLGTDLVKPKERLLAAYNDPQGVTAAFNKNILARINSELQGNFDLSAFKHEVRWNYRLNRIEMHLVCTANQIVEIDGVSMIVRLRQGETIHTESSHKYRLEQIGPWLSEVGLYLVAQWVDDESLFATTLARVR